MASSEPSRQDSDEVRDSEAHWGSRRAGGTTDEPPSTREAATHDARRRDDIHRNENWLDGVLHREPQMQSIAECVKSDTPNHMWLYGKPGTGKTSVLRHVLDQICGKHGRGYVVIDCWETDTHHRVFDEVARQLDQASAKRTPLEDKARGFGRHELEDYLAGQRLVVVLDHIDQPSPKERNAIIYNLSMLSSISLVCVSRETGTLYDLDPRVRSRLNAAVVAFEPFSPDELMDILEGEAKAVANGLSPDRTALKQIAEMANGDARLAIEMLGRAAHVATQRSDGQVTSEHVSVVQGHVCHQADAHRLEGLTEHHQLLHSLVPVRGEMRSDDLRRTYLAACQRQGMRPIAARTHSKYLHRLIHAQLLIAQPALGRDNLRVFRRASETTGGESHDISKKTR